MSGVRDEDKEHSHRVADERNVVQFAREAGQRREVDGLSVPRSEPRIVQHYVDSAGRPTVVKEADGRTDVFVGDDQLAYFPDGPAKTKWHLAARAEELSARPWTEASRELRDLRDQWKAAGTADRSTESVLWGRFKAAQDRHFEARNRDQRHNRDQKERLVSQAESLANSSDLRSASDQMRKLGDEWKQVGRCEKADEDRLWARFNAARTKLNDRKKQEFEKRQREWAANKAAKERLVSQAESLANSSDLRSASDQMRKLGDEWKKIGPCEKADNERLWSRFNAARTRLKARKDQEFEKRKRDWAANKATKERLVAQMSALASSSDFRSAKDQARAIDDQWRAAGPCEKADNDRLWQSYKAAKDRVWEAAKRAGEQRKAEARQRAQDRVWRLEEQLRNVESAIYRAQESYSRALSARSPSMKNPNWMRIVDNQRSRQSAAQAKLVSLGQRKSEIISKLLDARSRLGQF